MQYYEFLPSYKLDLDNGYSFQDYAETVVTPADEPVSYKEVSDQLRLDTTDDRDLVIRYGVSARQSFEHSTNIVCVSTTFKASFADWQHGTIRIPRRPVTAVTAVKYLDSSGTEQTLPTTSYVVDCKPAFARVILIGNLPTLKADPQAVRVTYVAGVAAHQAAVPADIKIAIAQHAATLYENREHAGEKKLVTLPHGYDCVVRKYSAPKV